MPLLHFSIPSPLGRRPPKCNGGGEGQGRSALPHRAAQPHLVFLKTDLRDVEPAELPIERVADEGRDPRAHVRRRRNRSQLDLLNLKVRLSSADDGRYRDQGVRVDAPAVDLAKDGHTAGLEADDRVLQRDRLVALLLFRLLKVHAHQRGDFLVVGGYRDRAPACAALARDPL